MEGKRTEAVGPYTLVAGAKKDVFYGVIWEAGRMIEQLEAASLDEAETGIQQRVGELLQTAAQARGDSSPTVTETVAALHRVWERLSQGQRAMLRAHYSAPDRCMTATQLSEAANYKGHSPANAHYGRVGLLLYGELPVQLPRRKTDGKLIFTCAIAEEADQRGPDEAQWIWKMRPHIAEALAAAKLV